MVQGLVDSRAQANEGARHRADLVFGLAVAGRFEVVDSELVILEPMLDWIQVRSKVPQST